MRGETVSMEEGGPNLSASERAQSSTLGTAPRHNYSGQSIIQTKKIAKKTKTKTKNKKQNKKGTTKYHNYQQENYNVQITTHNSISISIPSHSPSSSSFTLTSPSPPINLPRVLNPPEGAASASTSTNSLSSLDADRDNEIGRDHLSGLPDVRGRGTITPIDDDRYELANDDDSTPIEP